MRKCTRFVGLDDSKDSIDVAVAAEGRDGEVRSFGSIPNTPGAVKKLVRRLGRPEDLHFVYEAGPCGYGYESPRGFQIRSTKARQRLLSFLLRHGRRYPGRSY